VEGLRLIVARLDVPYYGSIAEASTTVHGSGETPQHS